MRSTAELRRIWGPDCASSGQLTRFTLYNGVKLTIRRECEEAVRALDGVLQAHNYQPRQADTAAMNCRKITGGSGLSLHSFGIAIDINWQLNGYGRRASTDMPMAMVEGIEAIRTRGDHRVWQWGGRWSTPDYMHVEVVASPAELATGIASTVRTTPRFEEDFIMHGSIPPNSEVFEALDGVALNAPGRQAYLRVTARDKPAKVFIGGFVGSPGRVVDIAPFGDWAVKIPRSANALYIGSGPDNPQTAWVVTPSAA